MCLIYRIVSEKLSLKTSKISKQCMGSTHFCHPAISQFSIAVTSFVIACKRLKIAEIAQINFFNFSIKFVHTVTLSMGKYVY